MFRCKDRTFRLARGLLAFLFAFTLIPVPLTQAASPDPPDRRFGVVEAFWSPTQATDLGVGWERVIFAWKALQPNSPNDWNQFYFPDDVLAQETSQGREVVGLLMTTPAWASGSNDLRSVPKNLNLPYDDPNNYWGAFVKKIAARYRGRIDTWIVWNEPDIWDAQRNTSTWLGSEADYYQLLKTAYQAAKSVNPSAKVGFAGLTYWWDKSFGRQPYLKRVLDVAASDPTAKANGFYFDFINVHLYNLPQQMYTVPQSYKQLLADYELTKPIWLSEMNVVPYDDPVSPLPRASYRADLDEQASFVIQATAMALAGGVERISLYKMRDDSVQPPGSEPYGLMRNDGSTRPSFASFKAVAKYFAGTTDARWLRSNDLNSVTLRRGAGTTTVLWNNSSKPVMASIPAVAASGLLVDKYGLTAMIRPTDGKYSILLPPAEAAADDPLAYSIGGDPMMLVEAAPTEAGAVSEPRKEQADLPSTAREIGAMATQEQSKKQDASALLLTEAQSLIDRSDWKGAATKLQQLSEIDPQNPKLSELQFVVQRETRTPELQARAVELYRLQDWQGAAEVLRQLIIYYPDDPLLKAQLDRVLVDIDNAYILQLAEDFVKQGRFEEARQAYNMVLSKDPSNRKAIDGLARLQVPR